MKIEKLNKDNIKEFIRDMKMDNSSFLERNINKYELYAIKNDDMFYLGFISLEQIDTIAIINYNPKLSSDDFYACIQFLSKSLVVENHLIIEVYDEKYMNFLDDKYKCREMLVTSNINNNMEFKINNVNNKCFLNENFIDIEMNSIKYSSSDEMLFCNLVKQNIQDEKMIMLLHEYFKSLNIDSINFIIYNDSYELFKDIGYDLFSKSYIIRNDLF